VNKTLIFTAFAAGLATTAGAAVAWAASPAETISARQSNFKQIGRAQKAISDELKKSGPDIGVIRSNAQTLANLAPNVARWFPRGTGKEAGAKTGALPAIWQQTAQFNRSAGQLTVAARNLQRAAAGGDVAQIRAAVPPLGASCKGCHDTFKGDK
jgi:cytochrome c556